MTTNSMARSEPNVSYAHLRTERISLTAAIPDGTDEREESQSGSVGDKGNEGRAAATHRCCR